MLNYEFPPIGGGGANANHYILKEFAARPGLSIDLVTSSETRADRTERFAPNITLHRLNVRKKALHYWTQGEVLRWLRRARRYVKRSLDLSSYDVCHAIFGFPSGLVAYLVRKRLPYIVSLRGSDVPGFNQRFSAQYVVLRPVFRRIWRRAAAVIANSEGLRDLALETDDLPIGIIPNGVDTDEFTPAEIFIGPGPRLICVSRLIERKGIDTLIHAMPAVIEKHPRATLTVFGEGNIKEPLEELVRSLGLSESVRLPGRVAHEDLPARYREADLFVLPSKNEGMSNTVLEAVASGLPVVGTTVGGNDALVREGENGFLVAPQDTAALANAILSVTENPEAARDMGRRSREIAERMGWHQVAEKYAGLYASCAGAAEPRAGDGEDI